MQFFSSASSSGVAALVVLAVRQEDEHADVALALRELTALRRSHSRELGAAVSLGTGEHTQRFGLVLRGSPLCRDDDVRCAAPG